MRNALITLCLVVAYVSAHKNIKTQAERHSCPLYQNIGCISDTLEKACEPDEGLDFIKKTETESIWMCCCPRPYMKCAKSERNALCDSALKEHIEPLIGTEDAVAVLKGVQKVRGALLTGHENCGKYFGPMEPIFTKPKGEGDTRSIERSDIFCETVTWQWEELGDGNEEELKMNDCPIPTVQRANGDDRKGSSYSSEDEL